MKAFSALLLAAALTGCSSPKTTQVVIHSASTEGDADFTVTPPNSEPYRVKVLPMPPLPPGAKPVVAASPAKRVTFMSLTRAAAPMSAAVASASSSPFPNALRLALTNSSANYRIECAEAVTGPWQEIYVGTDGLTGIEIYDWTWADRGTFYYRLVEVP